ncbi:glutamate--cysteine ligase [Angustibacter peucedani]
MRTVGVEEELLLVDPTSGEPLAVSTAVLREVGDAVGTAATPDRPDDEPGGTVEAELQLQQVETDTHPHEDVDALLAEVRSARRLVANAASEVGAAVVALGTSPLPVTPRTTPDPRYAAMRERFGLTQSEQLTCGLHVHVQVGSDDEGVGVLDRVRVWLPVITALSANSPYWQGADSGYASFRSQAWSRWPMAGPVDVVGSVEGYRAMVARLLATDVPMDAGQLYFDARLSTAYPTVELRVADVCLDAQDTALLAALGRALVDTAAQEWADDVPAPPLPAALVRLAGWRAARSALDADLLDPLEATPRPAAEVVHALLDHVGPALRSNGDHDRVTARVEHLLAHGTGARRQRDAVRSAGAFSAAVTAAVEATLAG